MVLVALTSADANAVAARTVALSVASVTRTFPLSAGLSEVPVTFGVYIPSSATGALLVIADARGGAHCFSGSTTASVPTAGSTAPAVASS